MSDTPCDQGRFLEAAITCQAPKGRSDQQPLDAKLRAVHFPFHLIILLWRAAEAHPWFTLASRGT